MGESYTADRAVGCVRPDQDGMLRAIIGEWRDERVTPQREFAEGLPSWYGFGELVVDRLVGVARCEVATIAWLWGPGPSPSEVRSKLGVRPHLSIEITNSPPRRVCTLDEIVWLQGGELYDIGKCSVYSPDKLTLTLTTP